MFDATGIGVDLPKILKVLAAPRTDYSKTRGKFGSLNTRAATQIDDIRAVISSRQVSDKTVEVRLIIDFPGFIQNIDRMLRPRPATVPRLDAKPRLSQTRKKWIHNASLIQVTGPLRRSKIRHQVYDSSPTNSVVCLSCPQAA